MVIDNQLFITRHSFDIMRHLDAHICVMAFNGQFVYQIITQAEKRGIPKSLLMEKAGVSEDELTSEDCRIDYRAFNSLFSTISSGCKDPLLGIHMSQSMNLTAAGLILQLAQYSSTFKDAMIKACEYSMLGCSSLPVRMEEDDYSYSIIYDYDRQWRANSESAFRHILEGSIYFLIKEYEALTNKKCAPVKVTLDYSPEVGFKDLKDHFNAPVFVRDNRNTVVFRKKDFETPIHTADRGLLKHLVEYAEDKLNKLNDHIRDTTAVSRIIMSHLPERVTVEEVASELNMSSRTLQRRLKDENTSFRKLSDSLCLDFARNQLKKRKYSLSEIAFLLNYSDLSAFSRAFKKKYGTPPSRMVA